MTDPIFIEHEGHRTWLKWHRARRTATDPVFTGARILEAMRLGASVEVDLVIHADGGCAILHNHSLEEETTGTGLVRETSAETLRSLHLRGNDGQPISDRVMLLEDLCALLAEGEVHPDALLQLDFKEDLTALNPDTAASFAHTIAPVSGSLILSGGAADAISLLTNQAHMRTGYDPCDTGAFERLKVSGEYGNFIRGALATAPDAEMIYLDYRIVLAAQEAGFDIVAPIHQAGKRVDAWTIRQVDSTTLPQVHRLLALKVDQITTDDPEGLAKALCA